jgi:hypothetical protein
MSRIKPRLGDALVVNYEEVVTPLMTMVTATCECQQVLYTAVSGTPESAKKLIYRKHVKHLEICTRQTELFELDPERR